MPYKLIVNVPTLGSQNLEIPGLGTFQNGTYDISDEEAAAYQAAQPPRDTGGFDLDDQSPTHGSYVPKWEPGPHLVEAIESMHGITLEEVDPSKPKDDENDSTDETKTVDPTGGTDAGGSETNSGATTTSTSPVGMLSLGPASDMTGGN